MIELNKNKYQSVLPYLKQIDFNYMFAKTVLNDEINGKVYVDNEETPTSFYILHSYGMSLLFGNEKNERFNSSLQKYLLNTENNRKQVEWLQVFPYAWNSKLEELLGENIIRKNEQGDVIDESNNTKVIENTRVNFKFDYKAYSLYKQNITSRDYIIIPTTKELYNQMDGVVVPKAFWKSAEHFEKSGVGFSLIQDGQMASTSYSAFIHDGQLELGIETINGFQGKGFAGICCSALIDYYIEKGLEPVWSCKLENIASYRLAQKIGFKPVASRPYYMVKV